MSDPLAILLAAEADRRVAGQGVPPLDAVRVRRVVPRRRSALRTAAPLVAAAASVVAVVLVAGQLHAPTPPRLALEPPPALVLDAPPQLGVVAVAASAATRLGAPSGHVNGPAVEKGDLLAASPTERSGQELRLVGAFRDSPRVGLVDRCTAVTTEPGGELLDSACTWSQPPDVDELDRLSADVHGVAGRTWLSGTAPFGTAAVLLQPDDAEQQQVPTAAGSGRWGASVHWVSWWPEQGTDVVAVSADGTELARTRLPSPKIREAQPGDPELGTLETPRELRRLAQSIPRINASGQREPAIEVPDRSDVLSRAEVEPGVTLYLLGFQAKTGDYCFADYLRDGTVSSRQAGGAASCGRDHLTSSGIETGRSSGSGTGRPAEERLQVRAPAGTVRLRLSAKGVATRDVRAYSSGARWDQTVFALVAWPARADTRIEALAADGSVLATSTGDGLDPRDQDPAVLEAQATCLEKLGVAVKRSPGGRLRTGRFRAAAALMSTGCKEVHADLSAVTATHLGRHRSNP